MGRSFVITISQDKVINQYPKLLEANTSKLKYISLIVN